MLWLPILSLPPRPPLPPAPARLPEALRSLTPGSNVPQRFDHLADRNLAFVRNHLDDLTAPAKTPFPHGSI